MGDTPPIRRPRASFVPHASIVDIPFKYLIIGVTSLPLFGLLICTFISVWKTYEEVTESVCGVSNFVPSISAVTGITPQLYIWRYLIGFQSGPRLILAAAYYQQHKLYASRLPKPFYFTILAKSALLLHMIDLVSFVGVAYVSNRENFPVHERLFIVFLVSSTMYMGVMLTIYSRLDAEGLLAPRVKHAYWMKTVFFSLTFVFIILLSYFHYAHRTKCYPNAFSWFSATEYGIAMANLGFHMTAAYDFQDLVLTTVVSKPSLD